MKYVILAMIGILAGCAGQAEKKRAPKAGELPAAQIIADASKADNVETTALFCNYDDMNSCEAPGWFGAKSGCVWDQETSKCLSMATSSCSNAAIRSKKSCGKIWGCLWDSSEPTGSGCRLDLPYNPFEPQINKTYCQKNLKSEAGCKSSYSFCEKSGVDCSAKT